MPRFCNKTFKRRKFGANYKDSSASEDLNKEQPASMYIKNSSSKSKLGIDIKFGRQIQGLATELLICCEFCGLIQPLLNTRFTNTVVNKKDTKVYEVNTRLAYAMRSVGKGEAAAKVFCGVMNLPPPPKRFYESLHALNNATEKVAKVSMALAAAETLSFNNGNPNVPVAIDGTWQKRGHTSLNGVVTAVSVDTGKVIDAEILSRKCSCHFNGNLHSDECSANYFGNSGRMEVEGALRIFNRSEVLHNLRYTQYLGDGDSKAYKAVLESKPYKDVNIEKLECVGHVEKRMGLITKLKVLDLLNIQPGFYTCRALQEADHARIRKAEKAISRRTKEARIKNRQLKCRQEDDLADDLSNPSYGSGLGLGSLVVRESDSRPEGLGSMTNATKYPPSTCSLNQWVRSLVGGCSRNHKCRGLKNISLSSSSMPKLWWWRWVVSPSIVKKSNLSQVLTTLIPSLREGHGNNNNVLGLGPKT
ncbi:uncharacterized protein TNCV_4669851 [Trichonephila clavipes]|nr:uncharacterized protein TNCV_4669851 [Trichonephila clavipes]